MIKFISLMLMLIPEMILDIRTKKIWVPWIVIFFIEAVILAIMRIIGWGELLYGIIPGILLVIISILTRGAIGLGDGYIVCVIGSLFGLENTVAVFVIAMLISAFAGGILMLIRHWKRKDTIPFVPFLLIGVMLQLLSL